MMLILFIQCLFIFAFIDPSQQGDAGSAIGRVAGKLAAKALPSAIDAAVGYHFSSSEEEELNPALRRSRRDTLCHDTDEGKQRCTSIQCDPKYGWCVQCSYDLIKGSPSSADGTNLTANVQPTPENSNQTPKISRRKKRQNPAIGCVWAKIKNGANIHTKFNVFSLLITAILFFFFTSSHFCYSN